MAEAEAQFTFGLPAGGAPAAAASDSTFAGESAEPEIEVRKYVEILKSAVVCIGAFVVVGDSFWLQFARLRCSSHLSPESAGLV